MSGFYGLSAANIDKKPLSFDRFKGKVVLVTNVASRWGATRANYTAMVNLHAKYAQEGFDIVAFPTDEFGGQELRTNQEIKDFVAKYGVEFTMMDKTKVNPPGESDVFNFLKSGCADCGGNITWNFGAKFLVDREGNVVTRFKGNPADKEALIKELLSVKAFL